MCGITGIFGSQDRSALTAMTDVLRHRGPDDEGRYDAGVVGVGHRRLSIIGIDNGAQPIRGDRREVYVVANCEIYNYRQLRDELRRRGHDFRTDSDAEVIVHLYEEYGDRCVDHLQGMFAFAIVDGGRLLLARDRFGIKPLHYAEVDGALLFGSEVKALLQNSSLTPEIDGEALVDTVVLGHPAGPGTLLRGVVSLPPGHVLSAVVAEGRLVTALTRYHTLPDVDPEPVPLPEAAAELMDLLRNTVQSHLMAEVEVGVTLSGGLDSTLLARLMRDLHDGPIRAYTIGDRPDHPDVVQARRLARQFGLDHHVSILSFQDFVAAIPRYLTAAEQPAGLGGIALNVLCRRIGRDVKVCLNGEGADEVFGGYGEYVDRRFRTRRMLDRLAVLETSGRSVSARGREFLDSLTADQPFPEYLRTLFAENMREQLTRDHLELLDASSMAASLEMRVPFLDHRVVEFAFRQPLAHRVDWELGITKRLLKHAVLTTWGDEVNLVGSVLRRKIGAPTSVLGHRERFIRLCEQVLPVDYLRDDEYGAYFDQKSDLLVFNLYREIFTRYRGVLPDGFTMLDFMTEQARRPALSLRG
ncbi:asparagine synthase (glutamine-hydrolyzing) [Micromonospora echinofusca]|uniref:asparagine synthase (glutamine-hydrolyzing) n=1 Tax=Micromonospora echinofusca TaxID=47858 RepID=A0A1C5G7M1_MICEH|nr:asparagine synthase (glutamine-hydrolyzing) [Micromonospora echinofusca]SCG15720.1 asparagine synthase (glutamine-hydrolysing) [Micromonospora echinofusca]